MVINGYHIVIWIWYHDNQMRYKDFYKGYIQLRYLTTIPISKIIFSWLFWRHVMSCSSWILGSSPGLQHPTWHSPGWSCRVFWAQPGMIPLQQFAVNRNGKTRNTQEMSESPVFEVDQLVLDQLQLELPKTSVCLASHLHSHSFSCPFRGSKVSWVFPWPLSTPTAGPNTDDSRCVA